MAPPAPQSQTHGHARPPLRPPLLRAHALTASLGSGGFGGPPRASARRLSGGGSVVSGRSPGRRLAGHGGAALPAGAAAEAEAETARAQSARGASSSQGAGRRAAAAAAGFSARLAPFAFAYAAPSQQARSGRPARAAGPEGAPSWNTTSQESGAGPKPIPTPLESVADDPELANPLARLNRLGTAWLGAIVELDGVLLSHKDADQRTAWLMAAEELGKSPPLKFQLDRAVSARNDVAVSELLHWAREPSAVRRMSETKEDIFRALQEDKADAAQPGVASLVRTLQEADVPICVTSTRPRRDVERALRDAGLAESYDHLVAAEDFYDKLDCYNYASSKLERPPPRCVVFGTSNAHIEAAHDASMKCVVVPSASQPVYELSSADLVLRDVSSLAFVNLKNLFADEAGVAPRAEPEPEAAPEPSEEWLHL